MINRGGKKGLSPKQLASSLEVEVGMLRDAYFQLERTKKELQGEKEFSQDVINSLPGTLFMASKTGKIIYWNKAAEDVDGYPAEQIKGMKLSEFFDEKDRPRVQSAVKQAFASGRASFEAVVVRRDGKSAPYLYNGVLIRRDGKQYMIGIGIDITKRKEAEGRAKEWDRVRTDFMNVAAHDLRTPATAIKGFVQMIRQGDFGSPPAGEVGEALAGIEEGVDRMISLVNDFLTLSRVEQKRFKVNLKPIDLADCIKQALREITLLTKGRPVELQSDIDSDLPPVMADRPKLIQVLTNLLDNAFKHTERGSVLVRTRLAPGKGSFVQVMIIDTGTGITPKDLPHIFDRYYRGKMGEVAAGRGAGLGLGLHIVRMIVEEHGGKVWADSELGVGTTVFFTLPLAVKSNLT